MLIGGKERSRRPKREKPPSPCLELDAGLVEERLGRQKRLREVMTTKVELALGFRPVIPKEIRRIVGDRLPETALMLLWVLPAPFFIWRDRDDPRSETILEISPVNMWKEKRYRELVEDYIRVAADNLLEPGR